MPRAQIAMLDLVMAVLVVGALFAAIMLFFNMYGFQLNEDLELEMMEMKALHIADTLVKNPGKPSNWESLPEDEIKFPGLAYTDRNLSRSKVDSFVGLEEGDIQRMFRIGAYDFFFRLRYLNGTLIASQGTQFAGEIHVNVKRMVAFENEPAIMEFGIWQ